MKLHIGTSGWSYDHWKGSFYPKDISGEKMLSYYANYFSTVEINATFYRLPKEETVKTWKQTIGKNFQYAVKASRYITHQKKLNDPKQSTQKFFDRIKLLQPKLAPILFQLPPRWHADKQRLANFIEYLPDSYQYVFEFRDQSWFDDEIIDLLRETKTGFCIYDLEGNESPTHITADFVYIRLHGSGARYKGSYSEKLLQKWVDRFKTWTDDGKEIFCYFNNDYGGHAPRNAKMLLELTEN